MTNSKAQIVATIGPASEKEEILRAMIAHGLDVARFNFSWGDVSIRVRQIALIRKLTEEANKKIGLLNEIIKINIKNFIILFIINFCS